MRDRTAKLFLAAWFTGALWIVWRYPRYARGAIIDRRTLDVIAATARIGEEFSS